MTGMFEGLSVGGASSAAAPAVASLFDGLTAGPAAPAPSQDPFSVGAPPPAGAGAAMFDGLHIPGGGLTMRVAQNSSSALVELQMQVKVKVLQKVSVVGYWHCSLAFVPVSYAFRKGEDDRFINSAVCILASSTSGCGWTASAVSCLSVFNI